MNQKRISILGSTGSIGTQTLDIIDEYPSRFRAVALTAKSNWKLLAEQARKYLPELVVIADESCLPPLREALADTSVRVASGPEAIIEAAILPECDIVVQALVGYSGLFPTVEAIKAHKTIALANKETLVAGGEIITGLLREHPESVIIPVDSEHSAIFQCLAGERTAEARNILLTASGGPFRNFTLEELEKVTPADALRHPNWDMGAKVTIDSASMMNKGFEMIEARWLFNCPPQNIKILVHPQSIVHSMVEFNDGSIKAQLGVPDMHIPIRYALSYPKRLYTEAPPLELSQLATLNFEKPDIVKFPLLQFAFDAIEKGGNMPCILNAANEVAVASFLSDKIRFVEMPELISKVMDSSSFIPEPTLEDLASTHLEATLLAQSLKKTLI
ncbi:MAG: 1-deoxy-D-xylulose-5-phosphate reductoisomerase [Muribaculaceae bacterium]|nr:1-deoxy-D-xylulose-5-phosphate reductoisomerase [Muribaculaceae bacterium]